MLSLPSEVLRDVLMPLDRWTLDDVQFTNRRFLQLIMERMSDVCLRKIDWAHFRAPIENSWLIQIKNRPDQTNSNVYKDTAHKFSDFLQALRSSRVDHLFLNGLVFTPELAALVLHTPVVAGELYLQDGSCAELTPTQFQEVLQHFSPTSLRINACQVRACQVTDELIRALSKNRVRRLRFPKLVPVDGGSFAVTDDAVVDLCMQQDDRLGEEGDAASKQIPYEKLKLYNGSFTKDLFKRLVEASYVSVRTQPLHIVVSPLRFEEEDLDEFAQHLSYRYRGTPYQLRVYDFPGEQHGAVAAVDLQIVLHPDKRLELMRSRRPHSDFHESEE